MRHMILARQAPKKPRPKDATAALPPAALSWSSPTPTTLVLSWTPGTDPDSTVLRHEVQINGGAPFTADSATGTIISGLTRASAYTVAVRAVSSGGVSAWTATQATTARYLIPRGWAPPLDDTHDSMRPRTGIAWTATVAKDGSGDFTTITDALKASKTDNSARTAASRAIILVKTGTYRAAVTELPDHTGLVGATGNPADVIIENVTDAASMANGGRGALDTWGATWVENITMRRKNLTDSTASGQNPKYSVHATAGTCNVWVNCVFDTGEMNNLSAGYPSVFGQDGYAGGLTVFYKCRFIASFSGADVNVHATLGTSTTPETVAYIGCTATTTDTSSPSAVMLGFKPMSDSRHDALYVVDCSVPQADMPVAAGSTLHNPNGLPLSSRTTAGTVTTRRDWPVPNDWKVPA